MTCEDCRFWDASRSLAGTDETETGVCRRHSPQPDMNERFRGHAVWPFTGHNDWCGEFEDVREI